MKARRTRKTGQREPETGRREKVVGHVGADDRKHLTSREVERLIEATKGSRTEDRDRRLLPLMFRHGLRVSEACGLKLGQVDNESRVLHVSRLKWWAIDNPPAAARRAEGNCGLAEGTLPDEAGGHHVLCQRTAPGAPPLRCQSALAQIQRRRVAAPSCPSPHAAPCVRLRPRCLVKWAPTKRWRHACYWRRLRSSVRSVINRLPGGRFTAEKATLKILVKWAYELTDDELVGGPKWTDSGRYDIVATPESDAGNESVSRDRQIRPMLRSLLADRSSSRCIGKQGRCRLTRCPSP